MMLSGSAATRERAAFESKNNFEVQKAGDFGRAQKSVGRRCERYGFRFAKLRSRLAQLDTEMHRRRATRDARWLHHLRRGYETEIVESTLDSKCGPVLAPH